MGNKERLQNRPWFVVRAACVGEVDSLIRPPSAGDTFR